MNWADCLVALQQREIDAVSTDDTILAGLVEEDPYLHIVGPDMADQPYGVGINLDNTGLVRFVNGTLERIRNDGTWNTLYRKWLTVLGPAPPRPRRGMWTDGQSVRDRTFGPRHPTGGRPDRDVRDGSTLSTQAVFRPDFGDEDNFPIRRSARTPSRKTGWPPPAGCARRSDGWAAAWWKSRGRPISIRLRP